MPASHYLLSRYRRAIEQPSRLFLGSTEIEQGYFFGTSLVQVVVQGRDLNAALQQLSHRVG
jgi:hypothetical protein